MMTLLFSFSKNHGFYFDIRRCGTNGTLLFLFPQAWMPTEIHSFISTFEFWIGSNGHCLPFSHSQTLLFSLSVNGLESHLLAPHLFPCQHCPSRLHFLPGLPFSLCVLSFFHKTVFDFGLLLLGLKVLILSDLESDYINPFDASSRINYFVLPEFIGQGALCALCLFTGHWFMFLLTVPVTCYHVRL